MVHVKYALVLHGSMRVKNKNPKRKKLKDKDGSDEENVSIM